MKLLQKCRICGNSQLEPVLDLGEQVLTGVFPKTPGQVITRGPLRLVKCHGGSDACGLLQLAHSYDAGEMYGENYGYRSGLNASMVAHLGKKVARIQSLVTLGAGDVVIDIGSNDGTTLAAYAAPGLRRIGVDPTGGKFAQYYPAGTELIADFFSAAAVLPALGATRAKVVTSFSMFYDLEAPLAFMQQVHEVLADDGIWVFEQSYMPAMLATNSYDTVCHEHLEFYGLAQIQWMAVRAGFRIVDVEFNDVNGGSFSVAVVKSSDAAPIAEVQAILGREIAEGLGTLAPFHAFAERVAASRQTLVDFVAGARAEGKIVAALGASTKGNVLLQYCGFDAEVIAAVGEVNPDKFGCFTPGSLIPIIEESELLARRPDYLIVLPWHFRAFFDRSPAFDGHRLVFPLPVLDVRQL
jgi:NDP-4-keto-2,6-dideoxyhexose 3-C-methyltransferase